MCVRMVVAYHGTWFVNSATHLWGYRNYETRDESRNLWWVALSPSAKAGTTITMPTPAWPAGHQWWEIDMTWWVIRGLQAVGLASDVHDQIPLLQKPETATTVDGRTRWLVVGWDKLAKRGAGPPFRS